ncbi:bifunctional hydroxymethylpyrimidine kinase/phosphomethylpyrimidine kinase [Brevibacterium samyangense]|uniref:Bifunctional hydroxymethylpyrimidine kinase/phosphomethylpyrimidine kinase n=1 Tax=Brevibacterium samyangense TaxID=366888 RepID=A0ABP5EMS2_9MICO
MSGNAAVSPHTNPPANPPVALSIAGTDPSGGAGIHADLKTFTALGAYGTTVITALVAQNTHGVQRVYGIDEDFVRDQFSSVAGDMHIDATKTGMLGTRGLVDLVCHEIESRDLGFLTVDPVMVSTSGHRLLDADAVDAVRSRLVPLAGLITPNLPEAALLLGDDVPEATSPARMRAQARELVARGARSVLLKGGHLDSGELVDVLVHGEPGSPDSAEVREFMSPRIDTANTHGTGCTLSAGVTARTAAGVPLTRAVEQARDYLERAIASAADWQLARDPEGAHGPVDHLVDIRPEVERWVRS